MQVVLYRPPTPPPGEMTGSRSTLAAHITCGRAINNSDVSFTVCAGGKGGAQTGVVGK